MRLVVTPPAEGAWNMAVDETLLEQAGAGGEGTLRFYEWSPATLSLGYFQSAAARDRHEASRGLPLVRRASGGGAIVHDRELTYSVVLPMDDRWSQQASAIYDLFHDTLLSALAECGIAGARAPGRKALAGEPFLCFERRAAGDVLLEGCKIGGSAQRRWRGALLQHGSVLLAKSPAAPELPGIAEITARALAADELRERWLTNLAAALTLPWRPASLTAEELQRAEELVAERFAHRDWTFRRL